MTARERLAGLARRQHGLLTWEQARAAGLSTGQVRHKVRSGEWVLVRPKVYSVAGVPPTWVQAAWAAVHASRPDAWLSHHSAAALWGLAPVPGSGLDLLTSRARPTRLAGVRAHRSTALFSADLTRHLGIAVTTPERTLVDLSGTVEARALGRMLDHALRRRRARLDRLQRCVGRLEGAPGRRPALVHELLGARLPGYDAGDSDLETRVLRRIVSSGLPVPVQQHRLRLGGRSYRVDLAYPTVKLAIELDGWEFHRSRTAFDDDRARGNALVLAGWTLVRFTSHSTDHQILSCVAAALAGLARSSAA